MYYITNHTDQIIAADDLLLDLLNVETIEALSKQIILGETHFTSLSEKSIRITTADKTINFNIQTSVLSSLMGEFTLVHLESENSNDDEENPVEALLLSKDEKDDTINAIKIPEDDDLIFIKESLSLEEDSQTSTIENESFLEETSSTEEPFTLLDEKDHELLDLTIPQAPSDTIEEISLDTIISTKPSEKTEEIEVLLPPDIEDTLPDTTPIIIDLDQVSESIGISNEDYITFLNEYIDTAISLESDLQSTQTEKRSSAIDTLTQLADVLQLPFVNDIMVNLSTLSGEESKNTIESFYAILSRITTEKNTTENTELLSITEPTVQEEIIQVDKPLQRNETSNESFGTISLEGIKPIHFDFQLEEAANDLSLPVELIEEFVHDFIEQAHIETEKMLIAYEKGDLDAIQKIGHLLKGASSNLRINPLSDTLYEIQFCEDSSKLEALIKRYWGQFLAFEKQIDIISN